MRQLSHGVKARCLCDGSGVQTKHLTDINPQFRVKIRIRVRVKVRWR